MDEQDKLRERLNQEYDSETLRLLAGLFGPTVNKTHKEDRLDLIMKGLEGDGLKWALDQLDDITRKAVAEAAYNSNGCFNPLLFRAKYDQLPKEWRVFGRPSNPFFGLFIINGVMPKDLRNRVRAILPPPPEIKPRSIRELPGNYDGNPLIPIHTEQTALHDSITVLHLIAGGEVVITPQQQKISTRAVRTIASHLLSSDGPYHEMDNAVKESIRAHAWPNIILVAHLAREGENRLELTREGQKALTAHPHEIIRMGWNRWIATKRQNEIDQYDDSFLAIMDGFDLQKLRTAVLDVLVRFPIGEWIETGHLINYFKTTGAGIRLPWRTTTRYYYFTGYHGNNITQESFLDMVDSAFVLTFLRVIAATMGVIDMAFITPKQTQPDVPPSVSIQQLKFVRITPLGAYCLGISEKYSSASQEPKQPLKVLPTLEVVMPDHIKTVRWESFLLERIAERTAEHVWKLDRKKILAALEQGLTLDRIRQLLATGGTPLPDTVIRFLEDISNRESALRFAGTAWLFEARDEAAADLFVHERKLQGMCLRAGVKTIAVPEEKRKEFFKTLKKMGYLVRLPKELNI